MTENVQIRNIQNVSSDLSTKPIVTVLTLHVETDIFVIPLNANLLEAVNQTAIAIRMKTVMTAFAKNRVMTIRVRIRNIPHAVTFGSEEIIITNMFVNAHQRLAGIFLPINAKRHLRAFRMIRTLPIPACAKYRQRNNARPMTIARLKKNVSEIIASSATYAPKTPIALPTNAAAKTVTAS